MMSTPPSFSRSRSSSGSSKGPKSPMTLDLSDLPPLVQPSPPSNTLLITNLQEPSIFHPSNLQSLRNLVDKASPVHTWAPLKSMRRIIVTFHNTEDAVNLRQKLDGEVLLGARVRVYFGEHTPLRPVDQHLQAPPSEKQFFISPPPSPPVGWEMRNEGPPNKEVHADDLATALARLRAKPSNPNSGMMPTPTSSTDDALAGQKGELTSAPMGTGRQRSGSQIVYRPEDYGDSPDLPAIAVEDTTESPEPMSPIDGSKDIKYQHTQRPPLELAVGL